MERIVIHAGAPKTATTFIQRGLHFNRELLGRHGIYLPRSGRLELEPNAVCHHHLAWALINPKGYKKSPNNWKALRAELENVTEPVVVLSSEVFSRVASKGDGAAAVVEAAREICDDVTIVYFVRNQLSLLNSLYGQRVKSLRMTLSFDDHTAVYRGRRLFDYEQLLGPWVTDEDVRLVALPFTESRDADPLVSLLAAADVDVPAGDFEHEREDVNPSLGPIGIEAARLLTSYLRGRFLGFDSEGQAAKRLYRMSSQRAHAQGWCDESFWGWTPVTAGQIVDYFADANDRFARAVWGAPWDLPSPIDKPTSAVRLLELDPPYVEAISRYVFAMADRYEQLLAAEDAA
jgi:hypothetical protein